VSGLDGVGHELRCRLCVGVRVNLLPVVAVFSVTSVIVGVSCCCIVGPA
jgi:ABC-type microcin C transport system permease subunit YejE